MCRVYPYKDSAGRHPEKNTFEFTRSLHIPHDPEAVRPGPRAATLVPVPAGKAY